MRSSLLALFVLLASTSLAQSTDGFMAADITRQMYCDVRGLISGNVGLFIGFVVALLGLLKMVQGSTGFGLFLIIAGVLVTSLPNLIEGFMGGMGEVLRDPSHQLSDPSGRSFRSPCGGSHDIRESGSH